MSTEQRRDGVSPRRGRESMIIVGRGVLVIVCLSWLAAGAVLGGLAGWGAAEVVR